MDTAAVEMQAVEAGKPWRPSLSQLRGKLGQFRIGAMGALEIGELRRMLLDGEEVKLRRPLRVVAPRLPRCQEVGAEAEAGLEDAEAFAPAPRLGQAAAVQEYVA